MAPFWANLTAIPFPIPLLRQNIFRIMAQKPHSSITQFIKEKQERPDISEDLRVS
jgi:hypothetical protein